MSGIIFKLTDAGRQALVNAAHDGTQARRIVSVGVTAVAFAPTELLATVPNEIKRIATIAGDAVALDTIHVTIRDEGTDNYSVRGLGLYLDNGVLLGTYSQPGVIVEKSTQSILLMATDMRVLDGGVDISTLIFGETNFINPPATTERQGVVELATAQETAAGLDAVRAVTPAGLKPSLDAKQPLDATLTALAGVNTAADRLIYATGADQFAVTPLTAFIRTLLDDVDAAAARATLGAAPLDSPGLTGVPTAPTAAAGTNTLQLATTAFVQAAKIFALARANHTGTQPLATISDAGTAAAHNVQASASDATAGAVLTTGAFGLGGVAVTTGAIDLNTEPLKSGLYYTNGAINGPYANFYGWVRVEDLNPGLYTFQTAFTIDGNQWVRARNEGGWTTWRDIRDRSRLSGTQPISSIDALQAALDGKMGTGERGNYLRADGGTLATGHIPYQTNAFAPGDVARGMNFMDPAQKTIGLIGGLFTAGASAVKRLFASMGDDNPWVPGNKPGWWIDAGGVALGGPEAFAYGNLGVGGKLSVSGGDATVSGGRFNVSGLGGAVGAFQTTADLGAGFADWNGAAKAALQMDCPNTDAAYVLLRATNWGRRHIGAMMAYDNSGGNPMMRIISGVKTWDFWGNGTTNMPGPVTSPNTMSADQGFYHGGVRCARLDELPYVPPQKNLSWGNVVEFAVVDTDVTVDLPIPYVMTGLRGGTGGWPLDYVFPRGRALVLS